MYVWYKRISWYHKFLEKFLYIVVLEAFLFSYSSNITFDIEFIVEKYFSLCRKVPNFIVDPFRSFKK